MILALQFLGQLRGAFARPAQRRFRMPVVNDNHFFPLATIIICQ
jgi:hypothetical protein